MITYKTPTQPLGFTSSGAASPASHTHLNLLANQPLFGERSRAGAREGSCRPRGSAFVGSSQVSARDYFAQQRSSAAPAPSEKRRLPRRGTTSQAAEILGCSTSLVRQLIAFGELTNIERPGKRVYRLDLDEVWAYRRKKMEEHSYQ